MEIVEINDLAVIERCTHNLNLILLQLFQYSTSHTRSQLTVLNTYRTEVQKHYFYLIVC